MLNTLPIYISVLFIITTFLTLWLFYKATNGSLPALLILLGWLGFQAVIGLLGFYTKTDTVPPRFLLLVLPPLFFIVCLFIFPKGRSFIDGLNLRTLTFLHIVRVPVELTLFFLAAQKVIPELMTFEGRNMDILSGLSAPIIYYWGFIKQTISKKVILIWNFICLGLLLNIVINAIFSAPFPFQKFAFDQPNIAVLYFPFVWLPCLIVPLVLLSHLVAIRQLRNQR
jgi:hypothetical protein